MDGRKVRENDEGRLHRVHAETDVRTALHNLAVAIEHYNENHRTVRWVIALRENIDVSG